MVLSLQYLYRQNIDVCCRKSRTRKKRLTKWKEKRFLERVKKKNDVDESECPKRRLRIHENRKKSIADIFPQDVETDSKLLIFFSLLRKRMNE
jgi:hypothetical protein